MPLPSVAPIRVLRVATALLLAGSLACSPRQAARAGPAQVVQLVFENESATQVEVWVVAPDVKTRPVGAVMAGATETLRVPSTFYEKGTISFYTRLRGSPVGPGIYDLRVGQDEPLRLRLTRDMKTLTVVR